MGPPGLVELEAKLDANPEPLAQFCLTGRLDNLTLGQPVVEVRSHGNAPLTSGPGCTAPATARFPPPPGREPPGVTTGYWWSGGLGVVGAQAPRSRSARVPGSPRNPRPDGTGRSRRHDGRPPSTGRFGGGPGADGGGATPSR